MSHYVLTYDTSFRYFRESLSCMRRLSSWHTNRAYESHMDDEDGGGKGGGVSLGVVGRFDKEWSHRLSESEDGDSGMYKDAL